MQAHAPATPEFPRAGAPPHRAVARAPCDRFRLCVFVADARWTVVENAAVVAVSCAAPPRRPQIRIMSQSPRIVVLDGYTTNPGDLSWAALEQLGTVSVHARSSAAEIVPRARDAEIVLVNKVPLAADTIAQLPQLRLIGVLATGHNIVDSVAARARNILVTNIPAYGTQSVAQHVFALLLELTQRTGHHAQTVRDGRWVTSPDWSYWDGTLVELAGLTLGIVGAGRIGHATGKIGEAFGMNVRYATRTGGRAELEAVLRASDVVSLHCPLTPDTKQLINATTLGWMKPSAYLINTGRGALIDEAALAEALRAGRLAGAGLDVLSTEPPSRDNPLPAARNCIVTPHLAWATFAARRRLLQIAVENVRAFLAGQPRNVVN
jgi:glycerate dehydrogenase